MSNELFGYSLFKEQKEPLRSFNRFITIYNLKEHGYNEQAKAYFNSVGDLERRQIENTARRVKEYGIDAVKKFVVKNMDWSDGE